MKLSIRGAACSAYVATVSRLGKASNASGWGWLELASPAGRTGGRSLDEF